MSFKIIVSVSKKDLQNFALEQQRRKGISQKAMHTKDSGKTVENTSYKIF